MTDTLKVVRGTHANLISKIDEYPEFSPVFATDTKDFYIKYQNKLVGISGATGLKITSIEYSRIDQGIMYYKATLSDGSFVEFPFQIKLDTTTIAPMELTRMKADGTIEGTGIIFNSTLNRYESRYDFKFPSNSIWIGENVKIGQKTGFVFNHTKSLNKDYLMIDSEIDPKTGSKKPRWAKIEAIQYNNIIQPDQSETLQNVQSVHLGTIADERYDQAIYFMFDNNLTDFCMELVINNKVIEHYPSENAWNGLENGIAVDSTQKPFRIPFKPEIINRAGYDITFNFKANEQINLKGKNNIPYYELDMNPMTRVDLATMDDIINVDTSGLAKADLSNVSDDDIKAKGFMKTDMEDVDLAKLYDKGIDAKLADDTQVQNIQKEIDRIGNQPKDGDLPTYVYRGNIIPTIPSTQYKAYYLHFVVLRNSLGQLTLPSNAPSGAVFSIENNDRNDYITLSPTSGDTINGKAGSYQAQSDTLTFFVKNNNDWVEAFGGVFPNNMDALRSTIKVLLPNELNTIDEIASQLKDDLTFKRAIQTEFKDQLHTFNQIEADLVERGYVKGMRVNWGLSDTQIPIDDTWESSNIEPNQQVIPTIQSTSKYLLFRVPITLVPIINGALIDQTLEELSAVKKEENGPLKYVILATENKIDFSTFKNVALNYKLPDIPIQGIELDDGTTNISGITKINLKNIELNDNSNNEATITAEGKITFVDGNTKTEFEANKVQSLDKSIRIAQINGTQTADLSKGKNDRNEGIHVMLGQNELINSKFPKSKLYFGDYKVKGGSGIYPDMNTKSFVLQDIDPQDDPNISGGTTFFIAIYYEPNKELENVITQDGNVKIELVDSNDNPLMDINGDPMFVQMDYETGDTLNPELYVGECQIKSYTEVHPKIALDFPNEEIVGIGANSQICIQSVTKDESGGPALDSFMLYTGYRFGINTRYYGLNSLNLARTLVFPEPETTFSDDHMELGVNLFLDVKNCKVSISNYHLNISDDGTNLPVWSLTKYYDKLDSFYMSGKTYKVTTKITDKDSAYKVALLKYTGTEIVPPKPKVLSYNNSNPVFTSNWQKVDDLFIPENIVAGEHTATKDFAIPQNSKGLAIIMYAVDSESPMTLKLKDLEGDITPWFNKLIITDNFHISEQYLINNKEVYRSVVKTPNGDISYRYTVNKAETKLPIGVVSGGMQIVNNNAWHDAGSSDPNLVQGDFEFKLDGTVDMRYTVRAKNEQATVNDIKLKLVKVNSDGSFTDVPTSVSGTIIEANRKNPKLVSFPVKPSEKFSFEVKANETYRFIGESNKNDGFYLESDLDGVPLIRFDINFEELTSREQDIEDRLNLIDGELVITPEGLAHNVYLELGWEDGKPVLKQKVRG